MMTPEQLKQMRLIATTTIQVANNEEWSQDDHTRQLAYLALLAIGYIKDLESKLEMRKTEIHDVGSGGLIIQMPPIA